LVNFHRLLSERLKNGVSISNHDYRSFDLLIGNPRITNANSGGSKFDPFIGSAIAIYHDRGNTPARTGIIGNVTIEKPIVINTTTTLVTPFHVWDNVPGRAVRRLLIVDPVVEDSRGKSADLEDVKRFIRYTGK